jgi:Glycosyl hydrolase family 36 C-terminal domain
MAVSKEEALVTHVTILASANAAQRILPLKGLDSGAKYSSTILFIAGDALLNPGLLVP